jgi:hypothetical protein
VASVDDLEGTVCHAGTPAVGTTHVDVDVNTRDVSLQCVPAIQYLLTVQSVTEWEVTSTPAAIDCGGVFNSCSAEFDPIPVTLTAKCTLPNCGGFPIWGGACTGTSGLSCTVAMDQAKTVTVSSNL